MKYAIETITPQRAKQMLDMMPRNRSPRHEHIKKMADDMDRGAWEMNGAGIVFDESGALVDGQHRLLACVMADVAFTTLVIDGVCQKALATIDTGKARTFGDSLVFDGVTRYRNETASAVRHILAVSENVSIQALSNTSNARLSEFSKTISMDRLRGCIEIAAPAKVYAATAPMAAIIYYTRHDAKAPAFVESMAFGAGLSRDHPILRFREWVSRSRQSKKMIRADERFNALCACWNGFVLGRTCKRVLPASRPSIL